MNHRRQIRPTWLACASVVLGALTGCGFDATGLDDSTQGIAAGGLVAHTTPGGFQHLEWHGIELTTGGGYYIIASCSGADIPESNMDSSRGAGVLETPSGGAPGCAAPRYRIHFSGGNPFRAEITIGPLPARLGAVVVSLDLDKTLVPEFQWDGAAQGWSAGCARDYVHVATGTSGLVDDIRSPCVIHDADGAVIGRVGLAERPLVDGVGGALVGPSAVVQRHVVSVEATDAAGRAVGGIDPEYAFTNHPYTHAIGWGFADVPAGVTLRIVETIGVTDPPVAALPCGGLGAGGVMAPGQSIESCDHRHRLVHQTDGNVVLYDVAPDRALWSTGTDGRATSRFAMQSDGNLVLYSASNAPLWQSGTPGHAGASLDVQTDGNVVVYARGGHALWATLTQGR